MIDSTETPKNANAWHGACGKGWRQRGNTTGHCSKCHQTFEGLSLFDWHQTLSDQGDVKCRDLSDAKWIERGLRLINGSWRGPELPAGIFPGQKTPTKGTPS